MGTDTQPETFYFYGTETGNADCKMEKARDKKLRTPFRVCVN